MDFLGIGPLELFLILLIALIVLGPGDMVKAGKTLGRWMRAIVKSPTWRAVQQTSREIRYLPNRLMREAGVDEIQQGLPTREQLRKEMGMEELQQIDREVKQDLAQWKKDLPDNGTSPTIHPPVPPQEPGETSSPNQPTNPPSNPS